MSKTIATQIAEVAVNTKFENLPEEAVVKAKTLTLDVLASMLGTRDVISSTIAREVAEELGGPAEATIVGSKDKVAAPNAAFANAIQCYGLDFVDDHNESNAHPSPATFPASMALSEMLHRSGKEYIEAVSLGTKWCAAWARPTWAICTTRASTPPAPAAPWAPPFPPRS